MKKYGTHASSAPEGMFCEINFPVMLRLDEWTPDGRRIESAGFSSRELPLSVMAMFKTSMGGHDGAENAGSIDYVEVADDGTVSGKGWLLNEEVGFAVARRVRSGALRGNSVDLVAEDYTIEIDEEGDLKLSIITSKLAGTTVCPVPAFEGAFAEIPEDVEIPAATEAVDMTELVSIGVGDFSNRHTFEFATATQTRVTKELPPADAFVNPKLTSPSGVVVTSDNRTFGHIAAWGQEHLGAGGVKVFAPHSPSDYAFFCNGHVETDAGMLATGRLVIGGQHAAEDAFWTKAIDYYAATSRAWADVIVGEDEVGIWFAGLVRPGTADNDVYAARASGLSGDWRPVGADLELVAALSVNADGFPKPRAFAHNGAQLSLVGAGMVRPMPQPNVIGLSADTSRDLSYLANKARAEEAQRIADEMAAED